ncbi:uncharacterized protein LOC114529596 [Dendronephthya gigantea]|uniref:uncharacterized protein LOC114529596 n=1 Tax=Dendronephthya gigantea TaxID=151771 RepID=UPI00106938B3|nr:uncharacterized protein LOC114529596 [Dendronephthya gigantea]
MWLERLTIRRLALSIFLNVFLFALAGAQHTNASHNVSSAILTGSVSTLSGFRSTVDLENSLSTRPMKFMNTSKSKPVMANFTVMIYATGSTSNWSEGGRKMTTEMLSAFKQTSTSPDYITSSMQNVFLSRTLMTHAQSTPAKRLNGTNSSTISSINRTIPKHVSPNESERSMVSKTSQIPEKPLIVPGNGKANITDVGSKTKLLVYTPSLDSMQSFVSTSALKVIPTHTTQVIGIVNTTAPSSLQIASTTLKYSKIVSKVPRIDANLTFTTSTLTGKQANMTMILKPSPSLITKQQRSEVETTSLSETLKSKVIPYSKSSESILFTGRNDTIVQPKLVLFSSNSLAAVNDTMESILDKTMAKESVTRFSSVPMLRSKNLTASPIRNIFVSQVHTSSDIPPVANRSTIARYISKPDLFSKIVSNRSEILANNTIFGMIPSIILRPSTILSSFYNTLSNRTEEIAISPSMTIKEKPKRSETKFGILRYSTQISDKSEVKKPYITASSWYIGKERSTPVLSTLLPMAMVKEQQFRVTILILSEKFQEEYLIKSSNEFKQKSREIETQFNIVFQSMPKYVFTEVLKFFSGSLGCDVIIHTKSKDSEPVSVVEVNDTLNKARNTKGGFGKYIVGDIKVKEESPDVEGRDEDEKDEKETWGRIPIIVVSILGGVCFVLIVMVISQCIQRRHYSHSLADSNEIQEYSPAIHLKNNDDVLYKDEERVPMTTFNQTDIY